MTRFEGKTEEDAVATALKHLKRPAAELSYTVVRDEKSFWGGRVVEIEVADLAEAASRVAAGRAGASARGPAGGAGRRGPPSPGRPSKPRCSTTRPGQRPRQR